MRAHTCTCVRTLDHVVPLFIHFRNSSLPPSLRGKRTQMLTLLASLYSLFSHSARWTESMTFSTFHSLRNERIQRGKKKIQTVPISRQVFMPRRSRCLYTTGPNRLQGWVVTTVSQQGLSRAHGCSLSAVTT